VSEAKPNRTKAEDLYDHFVDRLVDLVKPDADGTPPKPDAASLNVVRQFLKEQNISADEDKHTGLKELKEKHKLPFGRPPSEEDE
jgi:hypothetical protein